MKFDFARRTSYMGRVEWPGHRLGAVCGRLSDRARIYLTAYRQARAAQDCHEQLSRMSDADLARLGIARTDIVRHVRERLDRAP